MTKNRSNVVQNTNWVAECRKSRIEMHNHNRQTAREGYLYQRREYSYDIFSLETGRDFDRPIDNLLKYGFKLSIIVGEFSDPNACPPLLIDALSHYALNPDRVVKLDQLMSRAILMDSKSIDNLIKVISQCPMSFPQSLELIAASDRCFHLYEYIPLMMADDEMERACLLLASNDQWAIGPDIIEKYIELVLSVDSGLSVNDSPFRLSRKHAFFFKEVLVRNKDSRTFRAISPFLSRIHDTDILSDYIQLYTTSETGTRYLIPNISQYIEVFEFENLRGMLTWIINDHYAEQYPNEFVGILMYLSKQMGSENVHMILLDFVRKNPDLINMVCDIAMTNLPTHHHESLCLLSGLLGYPYLRTYIQDTYMSSLSAQRALFELGGLCDEAMCVKTIVDRCCA